MHIGSCMSRFALQKCSNLAQMLLANLLIARVMCRFYSRI